MQEADPIEAYRLQANLKSIHRSDTAVQAILSSSNYATIYHYEQEAGPTGEGEWVKQKAEGPLFVVKRNTSPEHAIFMLNRQTVKNVTIPLVPGEMKVTAVGAGMLQIARRGEKVRRGVWFSEGEPMVEKFRQTILSMCGEPSARPAAVPNHSQNGMTSSPIQQDRVPAVMASAPSPNAASGAVGGDGLSRLFAGLMPTGPSISNPAPAPVSSAGTNPPAAAPAQMPHTHDAAQSHPVKGHHPTPTAQPKSPSPVPPASHPVQRPGETVDDLLNSILGVGGAGGGGIKPPNPFSPPPVQHQPNPTANAQAPPDRSMTPSHTHPDPPAALHVGTASPFPSLPQPPTQSGQGGNHRSNSPFAHPAQMGSPGPAIMQSPLRREQRPNGDMPPNGIPFPGPPAPPQHVNGVSPDPGLVAREAVVDVLQRAMPDMRQGGKDALARTVAGLIANEPRFVDDLWESYVRRLNGAPG